jgi:hypothetical protein
MTTNQFNAALDKLGLSIVGSSPYLGISRRQAQRISAGECPVPEPVAKLLRVVINHQIDLQELDA